MATAQLKAVISAEDRASNVFRQIGAAFSNVVSVISAGIIFNKLNFLILVLTCPVHQKI